MIASEYYDLLEASEWHISNLDTFLRELQGGATLKNAGILAEYTPKQIKKIERFCRGRRQTGERRHVAIRTPRRW